jgi:hypothetical protein
MKHEELKKVALKAINAVFTDTSVSPEITVSSLKELREEVDVLIDAAKHTKE